MTSVVSGTSRIGRRSAGARSARSVSLALSTTNSSNVIATAVSKEHDGYDVAIRSHVWKKEPPMPPAEERFGLQQVFERCRDGWRFSAAYMKGFARVFSGHRHVKVCIR